jgi:hypothetical protein
MLSRSAVWVRLAEFIVLNIPNDPTATSGDSTPLTNADLGAAVRDATATGSSDVSPILSVPREWSKRRGDPVPLFIPRPFP